MFQFPFGTMHQLNLDWFLQQWEIYKQEWADAQAGIDNTLQGEIDRVEDAMTDLYDARDAAVQAKEDAEDAADSVVSDAAQCGIDALKSEGFAVGEQDGTPVGAGSPYYQQNAKYYKVEAGTYRYLSEAYAKGEMGGSPVAPGEAGYQDNAKYYKDAADLDASTASSAAASADADALLAEGYSVGEQNGTPVSSGSPYYQNNAKYYAAETQQDKEDADTFKAAAQTAALKAEGWAIGEQNGTPVASGSPYYENNAEYYKDLAASVVLGADGAAAQAMIAGEEVSTTLTADYPAGSYIRVLGTLYRTTVDLQTGDTLTTGTNCTISKIADDLLSLNMGLMGVAAEDFSLLPFTKEAGYIKNTDGTVVTSSSTSHTEFIPVGNYKFIKYRRKGTTSASPVDGTSFYDENYTFIVSISTVGSQENSGYMADLAVIPVPDTAKYARFSMFTDVNTYGDFIAYGYTKIAFDEKINYISQLPERNLLGWQSGSFNSTNGNNYSVNTFIRNQKMLGLSQNSRYVYCDIYHAFLLFAWDANGVFVGSRKKDGSFTPVAADYGYTRFFDFSSFPNYTFKVAMERIPQSSSITTDDGVALFVVYDKIETVINSMIAPVLKSYIADTNLQPNNFRIVDNTLYQITQNISAGAALTPGTNCQKTDIASILEAILNS